MNINNLILLFLVVYTISAMVCVSIKYLDVCKELRIKRSIFIMMKVSVLIIIKIYLYPFRLILDSIKKRYDENILKRFLNDMYQIPYTMECNIVDIIKEGE